MSEVILDTITGKSTATTITIGSTPVVSTSANSMTIRGEGTAQTSIQQGLVKAWARLDGTGTIALADSFNNASTTDNGTGVYFFNFTNAFSNANYAVTIAAANAQVIQSGANTTSQCKTLIRDSSSSPEDTDPVYNTNVGDLA
jgi:hypothetical protein